MDLCSYLDQNFFSKGYRLSCCTSASTPKCRWWLGSLLGFLACIVHTVCCSLEVGKICPVVELVFLYRGKVSKVGCYFCYLS